MTHMKHAAALFGFKMTCIDIIGVTRWSFTFVTLSWVLFVSTLHFMCLFAVSLCQRANYFIVLPTWVAYFKGKVTKVIRWLWWFIYNISVKLKHEVNHNGVRYVCFTSERKENNSIELVFLETVVYIYECHIPLLN